MVLSLLLPGVAESVFASENPKLQWFNSDGHIAIVNWKTETRWVWKEQKTGDVQPVFEVSISIPKHVQINEVTSSNARLASSQDRIILETQLPSATIALNVRSKARKGKLEKVGLMVSLETSEPEIMVHETCLKNGVSLKPNVRTQGSSRGIFFVGLSCSRSKSDMTVQFHLPEGTSIRGSSTRKVDLDSPQSSEAIQVVQSSEGISSEFTLSVKPETRAESSSFYMPLHRELNAQL